MPIEINRPSDAKKQSPRLSKVGMASLALLVLLLLAVVFMIISSKQKADKLAQEVLVIDNAVAHTLSVCKNVAAALGDESGIARVADYVKRIEGEKDPLLRVELSLELVGNCLGMTGDRRDLSDELNGARNRLQIAVREYRSKL